jgi:phosphoenolpyruvate-protein kinase (PTS system EI component)
MMVEVPAAALLAERFTQHADFFAVGTNDLAHYTLAFDHRDNRSAVQSLDPAVLDLLQRIIAAASDAQLPCSMCGDLDADPVALCLALGLGYRQISVPVSVVPLARAVIRNVDLRTATEVARDALGCGSAEAVREMVVDRLDDDLGPLWREQGIV